MREGAKAAKMSTPREHVLTCLGPGLAARPQPGGVYHLQSICKETLGAPRRLRPR